SFMGVDATEEEINDVVEWTSFENMKKLEQNRTFDSGSRRLMIKDPDNPGAYKVRRGKVGGYTDYFDEQEQKTIDKLIARIAPVYGYRPRTAGRPE
ncbi:MAG: sulfotransferase domain-containing protein, partial [Gammaproteobacteria bacterium]